MKSLIVRSASIARRLSVFYMFVIVLALFFGIYSYKFMPENQRELNDRGFRILNKLNGNIKTKFSDVQTELNNIYAAPQRKCYSEQIKEAEKFKEFTQDKIGYDTLGLERLKASFTKPDSCIVQDRAGYRFLFYTYDSAAGRPLAVTIPVQKYLESMLESRDDLFESFMLLMPIAPANNARPEDGHFRIVYQEDEITSSGQLNTDSAFKQLNNTDLSVITDSRIGGKDYTLFLQPFMLRQDRLILAGMVEKVSYRTRIKTIPVNFATTLIIIILILVIMLPFLKIFFLSRKENTGARDVFMLSISIFFGSAVLLVILLYSYMYYVTEKTFNARLSAIGQKMEVGIDQELQAADRQLTAYDSIYRYNYQGQFSERIKELKVLQNNLFSDSAEHVVNRLFSPGIYKNISRVFWLDSAGHTLAKWNPFDFRVPLTSVRGFSYFDSVMERTGVDDSAVSHDVLLVSAGKSNATGEYQVYISKKSENQFPDPDACDLLHPAKNAQAITLAAFLQCSNYPLLPPGFGFSIIDNNSFTVLVNDDARKNLAENILEETMDNNRLRYCIQYKNTQPIDQVMMYGTNHVFQVIPLSGQALSLIVYYDKSVIFQNLFRVAHFTAESLLYLFGALAICIFASTGFNSKPSKLRFSITKVNWIRPSEQNIRSYAFTSRYWFCLVVYATGLFVGILFFNSDLRSLFYVSILLPFYALWGFVASRKKESEAFGAGAPGERAGQPRGGFWKKTFHHLKEIIQSGFAICFFIILINGVFISFIAREAGGFGWKNLGRLAFFQLVVGWLFYYFYASIFPPGGKTAIPAFFGSFRRPESRITPDYTRSYLNSLAWSVVLVSFIPVLGIFLYGFQSEKLQYLKNKELSIAARYENRVDQVANNLLRQYKEEVKNDINPDPSHTVYFDSLKFRSSQYFADDDSVINAKEPMAKPQPVKLADETYLTLMDNLFLITANEFDMYSLRNAADDGSWYFSRNKGQLKLAYKGKKVDGAMDHVSMKSTISSVGGVLWGYHSLSQKILILLFVLIAGFVGYRLLESAMSRIFLLDYFATDTRDDDSFIETNLLSAVERHLGKEHLKVAEVFEFFRQEREGTYDSPRTQEEYILFMTQEFEKAYAEIWNKLKRDERYFLYDFALDGYANYKDTEMLTNLKRKKILIYENNIFRLFSLSFRNFLLSKKGTPEISQLKNRYAVTGMWESMRIPILVLIAVAGIFIFTTQEDLSHKLSGFITSVGAIIPLLMKLTERVGSGSES